MVLEFKVLAWLASSEDTLPGLQGATFFLCPHMAFSPCLCISDASSSSLQGHQYYWIGAPFLWFHLTSITSLETLPPNTVTPGSGLQYMNVGGYDSVHNRKLWKLQVLIKFQKSFRYHLKRPSSFLTLRGPSSGRKDPGVQNSTESSEAWRCAGWGDA